MPNSDSVITTYGNWSAHSTIGHEEGFCFQPFNDSNIYFLHNHDEKQSKVQLNPLSKEEQSQDNYHTMIQQSVDALSAHQMDKVVLARGVKIPLPIDREATFKELLKRYPDAFCYQLYHPEFGFWMGASPETLIRGKLDQYETMALAGTQPINNIQWTTKEEEEQAFVKNEIVTLLQQYKVDNLQVLPRQNKKAGTVVHLLNTISFSTSRKHLDKIIGQLHPTSAVCGLPKEKALQYILEHEQLERKLYTGFLGVVTPNSVDLFVNLRCMEVFQNGGRIFVGGGITKNSRPENEWEETIQKSKTLKNILIHE